MNTDFTLLPEMQQAVAKHKLTEFTDVGGEVELELFPEEIAKIEAGAKCYDCSKDVFLRATLDCMFNIWKPQQKAASAVV